MSSFVASQSRWTWYTKLRWVFCSVTAVWRSNLVEEFVARDDLQGVFFSIQGENKPFEPLKSWIDQRGESIYFVFLPQSRSWKWYCPKGISFSRGPFIGSMLKFRGVHPPISTTDSSPGYGRWGTLPPPVEGFASSSYFLQAFYTSV